MVPALRAALICESVLTESDGVHSAIRIVDRVELPAGAGFEAKLLLMFANTERAERADHKVLVRVETAAAETLSGASFDIASPLEAGATFSLVIPFRFEVPASEPMFWLRFAFDTDAQTLTRVPIHFRRPT